MRIIAISALPLWVMGEGKGLPSIYYSAKRFADAGHEIHFITPQLHLWNGDLDASFRRMPRDEIRDRIHVHRFRIPLLSPMRISGRLPIPRSRVLLYSKALFDFLTQAALVASFTTCALLRARRVISESGAPDAVMAHNEIASLAAFLIARRRRIPSVTKLYGTFLMRIKWDRLHRIANFSAIMGFTIPCDCLIVDDDGTRGDCIAARLGVPPERFRFLMNGVDRGLYEPSIATVEAKGRLGIPAGASVILVLGRLERWKGVDNLLRAMPAIAAAHPACLALIVGDGTEKSALERLARELGVEERVRFEGAVPHARVKDYLHAADLFVSTQSVTNFGIHLMEAMVCGRCVVTLDTGDTGKHVVNGETGVLLEPGRIDLVAEAVTGLLGDDERRARLGANARAYAESHFQTWDERMDIEVRIVEDLVAGEARRRDRD